MLAVSACCTDVVLAEKTLMGMLEILGKLNALHCSALGGIFNTGLSDVITESGIKELTDKVDADRVEMGGKVNPLGSAIILGLLVQLPTQWSLHLRLLFEVRAGMTKYLNEGSVSYLVGQMAEVQKSKYNGLVDVTRRSVFNLNSKPAMRARDWAEAASGVFTAVVSGGHSQGAALAEAILQVGFPSVEVEDAK
jgi:hypothetical protein